jgi:Tol biopolymer transport system component
VYAIGTSLRAVRFDLDRLEIVGDPTPLPESVASVAFGGSLFAVSDSGVLLYASAESAQDHVGVWVDREGRTTGRVVEAIRSRARLSPDGMRVAFERRAGEFSDIWVLDMESGRDAKLTDDGRSVYPLWTPDGSSVTYASGRAGALDLYSKSIDLRGDAELVVESTPDKVAGSWTSDGQTLVYYELSPSGGARDILMTGSGRESAPLIQTRFNERAPRLSPNGRWLAYLSDRDEEDRLYVQRFPEGGPVLVSAGPASEPVWSRDGREIFYRNGAEMWAVEVTASDTEFHVVGSELLFEAPYLNDPDGPGIGNANYDVSLDGQHFLMVAAAGDGPRGLVLVLNWTEELARLLSVRIPAKLNADSEDAERGFRASRTRLGA